MHLPDKSRRHKSSNLQRSLLFARRPEWLPRRYVRTFYLFTPAYPDPDLAQQATAYWKKAEKEEVELRKKAEREALERARVEEAERERQRAAKRLQFLLDSGETYSKLMMKKIRSKRLYILHVFP